MFEKVVVDTEDDVLYDDVKVFSREVVQWLTKPSQCFVVLDRLAWCEKMT